MAQLMHALGDTVWNACGPSCARHIAADRPDALCAPIVEEALASSHALERLAVAVGITRLVQTAAESGPVYAKLLALSTQRSSSADRHVAALIAPGTLSARRRASALRVLLATSAISPRSIRRVFHFAAATGAAPLLHDAEDQSLNVLTQRDYVRAARAAVEHGHSAVIAAVARRIVLAELVALFGAAAARYARETRTAGGARGDAVARFEAAVVDIAYELEARDAFGGAAVVRAAIDTGSASLVAFFAAVGLRLAEPEGVALAHALARRNWPMVDLVLSNDVLPSATQREMHVFTAFLLTLGLGNVSLCAVDAASDKSHGSASVELIRELVAHLKDTDRVTGDTLETIATGASQAEEYARSCGTL